MTPLEGVCMKKTVPLCLADRSGRDGGQLRRAPRKRFVLEQTATYAPSSKDAKGEAYWLHIDPVMKCVSVVQVNVPGRQRLDALYSLTKSEST